MVGKQLLGHATIEERDDLLNAYHRRLTGPDTPARAVAASAWSRWEGDTLSIRGPEARPAKFNEDAFAAAFARIECHYFKNGGFFPHDGWLLEQAPRLRQIPAIMDGNIHSRAMRCWRTRMWRS